MNCIGDQEPYPQDNHANQWAPKAASRNIFINILENLSGKNKEITIMLVLPDSGEVGVEVDAEVEESGEEKEVPVGQKC